MIKLKCKECGKEFKVDNYRKDTAKFCSKECYWLNKSSVNKIKQCKECGKEFKVTKFNENQNFCSLKCYYIFDKRIIKRCKNCNTEYKCNKSDKTIFCSVKCKTEYRTKQTTLIKQCKECGEEFKTFKSKQNQNFCSLKCWHNYRKNNPEIKFQSNQYKNLIKLKCKTCGKEFKVDNYRKDTAKFCSLECRFKSSYNISKFSKNVAKYLKQKYNIEEEKCLYFNGNKKLFPDIIINNKIIECFGDYWHCNPKLYDFDFFNQNIKLTAKQIQDRDKERIDFLIKNQYNVFIIWENDWKYNKEEIKKQLKEYLKNEICKNKTN